MANKSLNESMAWALTKEAKEALKRLVESGLDYDLAYAILEEQWPEDELYELPLD